MAKFRNPSEAAFAKSLSAWGVEFEYEPRRIPFIIPQFTAHYTPDFVIPNTNIIIEFKGVFGGGAGGNHDRASTEYRKRICLLAEQHPDLDIRFVFQKPKMKIRKGSPTTYAAWATEHGFKWSHNTIPIEWIQEIKEQQNEQPCSVPEASC